MNAKVPHDLRRETDAATIKNRRFHLEQRLYSREAQTHRLSALHSSKGVEDRFALSGLGDLQPLRGSKDFGMQDTMLQLKYEEAPNTAALRQAIQRHEPPPIPYTALAARKLAEGSLWPRAPDMDAEDGTMEWGVGTSLKMLRHRENMSPSAQAFSDRIAYHLRRCFKAAPPHIAEQIDFSQLMLNEVIASRRSRAIYIVWSTVDPGARYELEPHLLRLRHWVVRIIRERIPSRPNLPHAVHWVYSRVGDGEIAREVPRRLMTELDAMVGDVVSSVESRVSYLKEMSTLNQRMKGIPWFMPYLWSKEEKAAKSKLLRKDVAAYEQMRREHKGKESTRERERREQRSDLVGNVQGSGGSVAPAMSPSPSFIH